VPRSKLDDSARRGVQRDREDRARHEADGLAVAHRDSVEGRSGHDAPRTHEGDPERFAHPGRDHPPSHGEPEEEEVCDCLIPRRLLGQAALNRLANREHRDRRESEGEHTRNPSNREARTARAHDEKRAIKKGHDGQDIGDWRAIRTLEHVGERNDHAPVERVDRPSARSD
jgi:hypothetical protein